MEVAICSKQQLLHSPGYHSSNHAEAAALLETKVALIRSAGSDKDDFSILQQSISQPFIEEIIEALHHRFPIMPLLDSLSIFQPERFSHKLSELATYGNDKIQMLLEEVGKAKTNIDGEVLSPLVDSEAAASEWLYLKSLVSKDAKLRASHGVHAFIRDLSDQHRVCQSHHSCRLGLGYTCYLCGM